MSAAARKEAYRALQVFDAVQAGHTAVLIDHDSWAPHLNAGEFAVVDVADKSHERGELYAYRLDGVRSGKAVPAGGDLAIVQVARCTVGIWMRFGWYRVGGYTDGPLGFEHWPRKCLGRVVGVLVPTMMRPS